MSDEQQGRFVHLDLGKNRVVRSLRLEHDLDGPDRLVVVLAGPPDVGHVFYVDPPLWSADGVAEIREGGEWEADGEVLSPLLAGGTVYGRETDRVEGYEFTITLRLATVAGENGDHWQTGVLAGNRPEG